jgi:hypothetical protein
LFPLFGLLGESPLADEKAPFLAFTAD